MAFQTLVSCIFFPLNMYSYMFFNLDLYVVLCTYIFPHAIVLNVNKTMILFFIPLLVPIFYTTGETSTMGFRVIDQYPHMDEILLICVIETSIFNPFSRFYKRSRVIGYDFWVRSQSFTTNMFLPSYPLYNVPRTILNH